MLRGQSGRGVACALALSVAGCPSFSGSDDAGSDALGSADARSDSSVGCVTSLALQIDNDIYVVELDGSGLVNLTDLPTIQSQPVWSPDGARIAYRSAENGVARSLYVIDADGQNKTLVSVGSDDIKAQVWLSGSRLAFLSDTGGDGLSADVFAVNSDGSGRSLLATNGSALIGMSASLSAQLIVFGGPQPTVNDPFPMRIVGFDGSGDTQINDENGQPAFAPNGGLVAFNSVDDVETIQLDGNGRMNLTANFVGRDRSPVWSPASDRIYFVREIDMMQTDLYSMNADGTGQVGLTNTPESEDLMSVSPDGTRLAFTDTNSIVFMNVDGTGRVPIAGTAGGALPVWRPCQ